MHNKEVRGFSTFLLFVIFILTLTAGVILFSINRLIEPENLKQKLIEGKAYLAIEKTLPKLMEGDPNNTEPESAEDVVLRNFVTAKVKADYLQNKFEPFIDSTFNWLSGKDENPPTFTFKDLEPQYFAETGQPLPAEIQTVVDENLKLQLKENSLLNPGNYRNLRLSAYILGTIALLSLIGILLLAKNWKSRFRKTSLAFIIAGIIGLVEVSATSFVASAGINFLKGNSENQFQELGVSVATTLEKFVIQFLVPSLIIFGSLFLLAIIIFLISIFFHYPGEVESKKTAS